MKNVFPPLVLVTAGIIISGSRNSSTRTLSPVSFSDLLVSSFAIELSLKPSESLLNSFSVEIQMLNIVSF